MGELMFQEDGSPQHIDEVIQKTANLAERHNCVIQVGDLSENGRKFTVIGDDQNLLKVQQDLQKQGLDGGNHFSNSEVNK